MYRCAPKGYFCKRQKWGLCALQIQKEGLAWLFPGPFKRKLSLHIYNKIYWFTYILFFGCGGSLLLHLGFLLLQGAEAVLRCGALASHCGSFSCCWAQTVGTWASVRCIGVWNRSTPCGTPLNTPPSCISSGFAIIYLFHTLMFHG